LWGAAGLSLSGESRDLLTTLSRAACRHRAAGQTAAEVLELWLAESEGSRMLEGVSLECVAWAYALPALAAFAPAELWWELLEMLVTSTSEIRRPAAYESPLASQLWESELPLTLAWLLPEIGLCRGLAHAGRRGWGESLQHACDDELLAPRKIHALRARLASWTRSISIIRQLPDLSAADLSLDAELLTALRLTRGDGRQAFVSGELFDRPAELFEAVLAESSNPQVQALRASLPVVSKKQRPKKRPAAALPSAACHSEDAGLGLLRRGWSANGEMLAVRYDGSTVCCELSAGRDVFWSGCWTLELEADGKPLEQRSDWDNVCWVSDDDVDYLELEARLSGGVRVQRQMLLARKDRLLYLADAVLGQADCHLNYCAALPLRSNVEASPAEETREVVLIAGRRRCVVQPLALPEWRRDPRGGSLENTQRGLQLVLQRTGRRLYAPLLIDLDPRRARQPITWRQLTVAEDRQSVSGDVAVGYRVQIGSQQWLVYRALGQRGNRTLLGANLVSEFLFARFSSDGEAQPLLEIE
jgi:hypothetical protein